MLDCFENFPVYKLQMSKAHAITKIFGCAEHTDILKTVSTKFRKTFQERRLPILKIEQDNPQNFLTS